MTHRDGSPEPLILPTVIAQKGEKWSAESRKVAQSDAQRVLEAMVAEYGVNGAVHALNNQGFKGEAYRYLLNPLFAEAQRRRARARVAEGNSKVEGWNRDCRTALMVQAAGRNLKSLAASSRPLHVHPWGWRRIAADRPLA